MMTKEIANEEKKNGSNKGGKKKEINKVVVV